MSRKVLVIIGLLAVFLIIVLVVAAKVFLTQVKPVTLTYYGLWEDPSTMEEDISDWSRIHPNIHVNYLKQSQIQYRERITNALQHPGGPDIVRIHSSWLPMFKALIAPVPADIYSSSQFSSTFYPGQLKDLSLSNQIMAIPLETDGLVLYANQDLLNQSGLAPVTTWEEFADQVQKLTVRDPKGRITRAGAAMGAASNVDHWQDIVSLLFLQNGADITNPTGETAAGALTFYTDFVNKLVVWDETLEPSTQAFAEGKVVYYFGPTWRYFDIKQLDKNNQVKITILPVPQLPGGPAYLSSYWAEAVSSASPNQKEAFEFLNFLSSKEEMTKLYSAQSKLREFGEPYSRVDLQNTLASNSRVSPYLSHADKANSSYLASFTWDGDTGINSRVSKYYEDAINTVIRGGDATSALQTVSVGVAQILGDYGIQLSNSVH